MSSPRVEGPTSDRPVSPYPGQLARIITFRVSIEQFELLVRASVDARARSLSAFARSAALEKAQQKHTPPTHLTGDLTTIAKALTELDAALRGASEQIRRLLGPGTSVPGAAPEESGDSWSE